MNNTYMTPTVDSLTLIVRTVRRLHHLSDVFSAELSYGQSTTIDAAYGALLDALYFMHGEQTPDLPSSAVYRLVMDASLSDEAVASVLLYNPH